MGTPTAPSPTKPTDSADVDFFSFNATAGQAINLYSQGSNLPDEAASGDFDGVDLTLYNPSGEAVASTGSGPGDIFTTGTVATETGTYYVRVNDSFDSDGNAYNFGFEVADPDSFEPNDDTDNATPIGSGESVNGTVTTDDVDVFAVDAMPARPSPRTSNYSVNTRYSDLQVNTGVSDDEFNVSIPDGTRDRLQDSYYKTR